VGQFAGGAVVDVTFGCNDQGNAGVEQGIDLAAGGAAVEEDQLQIPLPAEECCQTAGVGGRFLAGRRFQEKLVAVGVASVVKDSDAAAVGQALEAVEDALERGILPAHDLAATVMLQRLQGGADLFHFGLEVRQARAIRRLGVGESEEECWAGCDGHGGVPG